ncbi:MAG: glutamine--fructose-6-phosphate transaminase (isomerizing) [Treponema sp.]|nr:glutamine--fructose-6-phosphate transaminase (isomerizing) [Treponema sp.]
MCGIVGYIGVKEKKSVVVEALKELEYRGYDSAGIAVMHDGVTAIFKAVGKLSALVHQMRDFTSDGLGAAIGHTRWATHGKPTEINAHPQTGEYSFVVHNGIIENFKELRTELEQAGVHFTSQTDTEVIVHLFEQYNTDAADTLAAWQKTIARLHGSFAALLMTRAEPDAIFFAKYAAPLLVSRAGDEVYFASSDAPLVGHVDTAVYLEDGQFGMARAGRIDIRNADGTPCTLKETPLSTDRGRAQKNGFRFFMEKEIDEQSEVAAACLAGRIQNGAVTLEVDDAFFSAVDEVILCGCGTSYHAALAAQYVIERLAKIRVRVEVASEFRYRMPLLRDTALFIAISQSGETADTLEGLKIARAAGVKTLALCNVDNSSITRLSHAVLLTRAGLEKGVASTKAFTTQLLCLWLLAVRIASVRQTLSDRQLQDEITALRAVPESLTVTDSIRERLHRLSKHYIHGHGFFFIGRDIFYPLALEGALKLKEISYLHAEGYPAGEMKHGPIALADDGLYVIALLPRNTLYEKTKSNVEELAARDVFVTALSPEPLDLADDFIPTAAYNHPLLEFFGMVPILQLFALEIAVRLGNDVDMPRNLAKSVTVE